MARAVLLLLGAAESAGMEIGVELRSSLIAADAASLLALSLVFCFLWLPALLARPTECVSAFSLSSLGAGTGAVTGTAGRGEVAAAADSPVDSSAAVSSATCSLRLRFSVFSLAVAAAAAAGELDRGVASSFAAVDLLLPEVGTGDVFFSAVSPDDARDLLALAGAPAAPDGFDDLLD